MKKEAEIWKDIPGFSNYLISSWGRIITLSDRQRKPRVMKPCVHAGRVAPIKLINDDGIAKQLSLTSLIAENFLGPKPENTHIHHMDGNPLNNYYKNLEYLSYKDHKKKHAKLTPDDIKEIRYLYVNHLHDLNLLAEEYDVSEAWIRRVIPDLIEKYHSVED